MAGASLMTRVLSKIELQGEHWIWTGRITEHGGTPFMSVAVNDKRTVVMVRRLLFTEVFGDLGKRRVTYACGVSTCVRLHHMSLDHPGGRGHNDHRRQINGSR